MSDVTFQNWMWLAAQPGTWWAALRHGAALIAMVLAASCFLRRGNLAALGLLVLVSLGLVASYVWAFDEVRAAFVSGNFAQGRVQDAALIIKTIHTVEAVTLVGLVSWQVWSRLSPSARGPG